LPEEVTVRRIVGLFLYSLVIIMVSFSFFMVSWLNYLKRLDVCCGTSILTRTLIAKDEVTSIFVIHLNSCQPVCGFEPVSDCDEVCDYY
jgi:hypothetical protein